MRDGLPWEVRLPSLRFDEVRKLKESGALSGAVELRRVVSNGLWGLTAIVDCELEADAALVAACSDESSCQVR